MNGGLWKVHRINAIAGIAGDERIYLKNSIKVVVIPKAEFKFRLYFGENRSQFLGEFFPGESATIVLPSFTDILYVVWDGDLNYAEIDNTPLSTLIWLTDGDGSLWRERVELPERRTFTADYKQTARPFPLVHTFAAQGRRQFATIWHSDASTRLVRVRSVLVAIIQTTAAVDIAVELLRVVNQPTGGNPTITPAAHLHTGTTEAECLALPTTEPSEISTIRSSRLYRLGVTGAADTGPRPQPAHYEQLVPIAEAVDETLQPYILLPGRNTGYVVTVDVSAATTISGHVLITYTEE